MCTTRFWSPTLATAELDAHRGSVTDTQLATIQRGIRDLVDELSDRQRADSATAAKSAEPPTDTRNMLPNGCTVNVLCLPANDDSDEIAGLMLAHLLGIRGYCVKVASVSQLASEMVQTVRDFHADLVCICALPPAAVTHARYLCKRLHSQIPEIEMVVGLFATDGDLQRAMDRIACVRSVRMVSNFNQAIDQIQQLAQHKIPNGTDKDCNVPAPTGLAASAASGSLHTK
jgi:hypothetical protein